MRPSGRENSLLYSTHRGTPLHFHSSPNLLRFFERSRPRPSDGAAQNGVGMRRAWWSKRARRPKASIAGVKKRRKT